MALGFLGALFGRRFRLPRDQTTRIPRAAKKSAKDSIAGMQGAIDKLAGLPGVADVKDNKRLPRGFFGGVDAYYEHYDAYAEVARKHLPIADAKRPGEPGGTGACYAAPLGVSGVEALRIYRTIRTWNDFPQVAKRLAALGEQQFNDIQAGHKGKDPEKIRMGGRAAMEGRVRFARRMEPCPFLNVDKQRCRIWDQRPIACRMHHVTTPPEAAGPDAEGYPRSVKAINIRAPLRVQASVAQIDKRMMLQISPFLYAAILQLLQLAEGQLLQELGEAPRKMQQDGQVARRANRNVKHAKKFKKKKKKK